MKVAIVVGTRPEIIKMASLVHECMRRKIPYVLIHSNQHFSPEMDTYFFEDLKLPKPHYNLNIGSGMHANQTGRIMITIEPILEQERPDVIFVQGDTNTTLAAALAATKLGCKVAHIEAGLRSYDKTMPEETNRIVVDHSSDYLFAITETQKSNLLSEGISQGKIHIVGNTVADALLSILSTLSDRDTLKKYGLSSKGFALWTVHRAGNVDSEAALMKVLAILKNLQAEYPHKIVWPMHPRTKKRLEEFKLELPSNVIELAPLNYIEFVSLEKNADLIFTDSGGVQEEACILKVPCITLRENTERPETVDVGANILTGHNYDSILSAINFFRDSKRQWLSPLGEGRAAEKILDIVQGSLKTKSISVIGLGYMGLPFACLLAKGGYKVTGFDISTNRVESINNNTCPYKEYGLPELLDEAVMKFGFRAESTLSPADVYIISVPTPAVNNSCDLSYVEKAMVSIGKVVKDGDLIILESTVRPNTCKEVIAPYFEKLGKKVKICFCPERAIPGQTIHELINNDRIIGGSDSEATKMAVDIYSSFVKGKIFTTSTTVAETAKLMENTFRDVNIALANEFSAVCRELGINVWEAIELANKHPRVNILAPGPGVGGHCIAVDPYFLVERSEVSRLIRVAREINNERPLVVARAVQEKLAVVKGNKVGVLGVSYKKNVDDCRETPAELIVEELKRGGAEVRYFDPYVRFWDYASFSEADDLQTWADVLVLVTDHDDFRLLKLRTPLVDSRNFFESISL